MKLSLGLVKYCGVALVGSLIPSKISLHLAMNFASSKIAKYRFFRILFDYSLPSSTKEYSSIPVVVLIPVSAKDFHQIGTVIKSIYMHSLNPIHEIILVSPAQIELPPKIVSLYPVSVIDESRIISPSIRKSVFSLVPSGRTGWVIQQIIKFKYTALCSYPVVVLDADTVLLRNVTFVDQIGKQLIQFSYEWHAEYETHYRNFLGSRYRGSVCQISFVTHYQVMQSDVVLQFLGVKDENDLDSRLIDWIECADFANHSPLSEYHSYGRFLTDFYPTRFRIESWRNFDSRNQKSLSKAILTLLNYRSYSLHVTS